MTNRHERITRKHKHFTERDRLIVQAVFYGRYVTNNQIERLFFRPKSTACRVRTRILFDKGYLRKRDALPNQVDVYYLGLQGRRCVAEDLKYEQSYVDKIAGVPGEAEDTGHDVILTDLYVSLVLQCRQYGWTLKWQNSRMLEMKKLGVQPDGIFKIEELGKQAFIEYTDALPSRKEMDGKLRGYGELFGTDPTPILWFTSSKTNIHQLVKWVKGWAYEDWVLLGLLEESFLTEPVWKWVKEEQLVRFIAPSEIIRK